MNRKAKKPPEQPRPSLTSDLDVIQYAIKFKDDTTAAWEWMKILEKIRRLASRTRKVHKL